MVSLNHVCRAIASAILPGEDEGAKSLDVESQISLLQEMLHERVDYYSDSIRVVRERSGIEETERRTKIEGAFVSTRQKLSREKDEYSYSVSCLLSSLAVSRIISREEKQYRILQNCLLAFMEYASERLSWDGSLIILGNAFILMDTCLTRAQNTPDSIVAMRILRDHVMFCENIKCILKSCFKHGLCKKSLSSTVGRIYNKWRPASSESFEEAILPSKAEEENQIYLSQDNTHEDYHEDKTSNLIHDLNEYEHSASQLHESYEWLTSQGSELKNDPTQIEVFHDILFKTFVLDSMISRKMETTSGSPPKSHEVQSNGKLSPESKYVNSKESFSQILGILDSLKEDDFLFSLWYDENGEGKSTREILSDVKEFLKSEGALYKASDHEALIESSNTVLAYKARQQKLTAQVQQLNKDMEACLEEKENVHTRWKYELDERRRLNEQLQELKGNIRVYCRIRGKLESESELDPPALIKGHDDTSSEDIVRFSQLSFPHDSKKKVQHKSFSFDRVYDASSTQKDVYSDTSELVNSVMDGSNVCIFAYGQTGSGKTHTMLGSQENPGIVLNALRDLFTLKSKREGARAYMIQLSIKEIYQEQVRDLLSSQADHSSTLAIRIDPVSNLPITPDQVCLQVDSMEECHSSILRAMESRKTSSTLLNERSSRSHLIVSVLVRGQDLQSKATFVSKLNLVDLAGSERLDKSKAEGLQKEEAIKINCSLSALSDVLMALKRKKDHIPYRNSKLTHLLQDSLDKGSKTLMLTTLAPTKACIHESLSSVRFAMKVKEVELAPSQGIKGERRPR